MHSPAGLSLAVDSLLSMLALWSSPDTLLRLSAAKKSVAPAADSATVHRLLRWSGGLARRLVVGGLIIERGRDAQKATAARRLL